MSKLNTATVESALEAMERNKLVLSVDCVIFGYGGEGLKILLLKCNLADYEDKWTLLGDVVNPQEDIDDAAHRVLKKYTGLQDVFLEQVRTFGKAQRHPLGRVVTTAYYSLMQLGSYQGAQQTDEAPVDWFPVDEVPGLAFDHKEILESCIRKLRQNLREHPIGFELLPQQFTLTQLQNLYEVVLGIKLDKRNFRRKLNSLNLLVPTGQTQTDVSHRPANLYRFDYDAYKRRLEGGFNFEI